MNESQIIAELQAENALLRKKLAMRSGLHVAHYSPGKLSTLYETADRFWLDRIHNGSLGPVNQPGGPIDLNRDSKRSNWRIPGDRVWGVLSHIPIFEEELEEPILARTPGELRRKAAA